MKKSFSAFCFDFNYLVKLVLLLSSFILSSFCKDTSKIPSPSSNFTLKNYEGFWYEIGKIQTKGGAFFEKDCVCTSLEIDVIDSQTGNSNAINSCRKKAPKAPWTNATGQLEEMQPPGHWKER